MCSMFCDHNISESIADILVTFTSNMVSYGLYCLYILCYFFPQGPKTKAVHTICNIVWMKCSVESGKNHPQEIKHLRKYCGPQHI